MASNYPTDLDTDTNLPDTITDNSPLNSPDHATLHNTLSEAVIAVETKVGTGTGSVPASGDVLTGTADGAADWFPAATNTPFNAKTFGATGNGTTDDTAALQATIDAAQAAGGGVVFIPAGTYKITVPLQLYSGTHPTITAYTNITIQGSGASPTSGTAIVQHTTGADCIKAINDTSNSAQSQNLTFIGFSVAFTGTLTNSGNGIYLSQFAAGGPPYQQCNFQNVNAVNLQGTGKYGFNFESIITSTIDTCTANSCANGFYLNGGANGDNNSVNTSVSFINCYANMSDNGVNGYNCLDNTYISFVSCACDYGVNSTGTAYTINGCNAISFLACGCELASGVSLSNAWKINGSSSGIGIYDSYMFQSKSTIDVYVTGGATAHVIGFRDSSSVSGSTGLKIDSGSIVTEIDCDYGNVNTPLTNAGVLNELSDSDGNITSGGSISAVNGAALFAYNTNGTDFTEIYNDGAFGFLKATNGLVFNTGDTATAKVSGVNNPQFGVQNNTTNFNEIDLYNDDLNGFISTSDNTGTAGSLTIEPARNLILAPTGTLNITNAVNMVFGTTTGTKIGTVGGASGQKLGFWNATPVVQPLLATGASHTVDDVITVLQTLGLVRQS